MFNHLTEHDRVSVETKPGTTIEARVDGTDPLTVVWYENKHVFDPATGRTGRKQYPRLTTAPVMKFVCPRCKNDQDAARKKVGTQFRCWVLCCGKRLVRTATGVEQVGEKREFEVGVRGKNRRK